MKVMTIVGTRPELIKLSSVIKELDRYTEHLLVHTGQNYDYELNEVFFEDLSIRKPDFFLNAVGNSTAETIGNIITKSDAVLDKTRPDAVLVYGDTNSCLSVISAKKRKIPVFHMEAGNRCFDDRVPEEINRRIVDHISDINMTLTEHARRYLIAEGIRPDRIIKTGSSMKEVLASVDKKIQDSKILENLGVKIGQYLLVSTHREENIDSDQNFQQMITTLNSLVATFKLPILVSTHPRTRKRLESIPAVQLDKLITFSRPFGFCDYIKLQLNAFCVISDSGTVTEEASLLNFPAVTIRERHERPEGMDEGTLIMTGLRSNDVVDAVKVVTTQFTGSSYRMRTVSDYDVDNVSQKVVRIILSYINYVNHAIWAKGFSE